VEVKANKRTNDEFEEDVLSGLADAINKSPWRRDPKAPVAPGANPPDDPAVIRMIIHCGDAPPLLELKDDRRLSRSPSACGMDERGVRELANQRTISVVSIQIRDPHFAQFDAAANQAFEVLTKNSGQAEAAFTKVVADNQQAFAAKLENVMTEGVINRIRKEEDAAPIPLPSTIKRDEGVAKMMDQVMGPALKDRDAASNPGEPPRFLRCWALERDLIDASKVTLEIQVILSWDELNNLKTALSNVVKTDLEDPQPKNFATMREEIARKIVAAFGGTPPKEGPVPAAELARFEAELARLPVKSKILEMTDEEWVAMTPEDREDEIGFWKNKLDYYQTVLDQDSQWFLPRPVDEPKDKKNWWTNILVEMFP
jgi:serine/threonine-protein kinase PpkA